MRLNDNCPAWFQDLQCSCPHSPLTKVHLTHGPPDLLSRLAWAEETSDSFQPTCPQCLFLQSFPRRCSFFSSLLRRAVRPAWGLTGWGNGLDLSVGSLTPYSTADWLSLPGIAHFLMTSAVVYGSAEDCILAHDSVTDVKAKNPSSHLITC